MSLRKCTQTPKRSGSRRISGLRGLSDLVTTRCSCATSVALALELTHIHALEMLEAWLADLRNEAMKALCCHQSSMQDIDITVLDKYTAWHIEIYLDTDTHAEIDINTYEEINIDIGIDTGIDVNIDTDIETELYLSISIHVSVSLHVDETWAYGHR